ncbi:AraC family transcriptional regulator [Pseudoalteromonas phenolica]|uniref:AraC family transcriptional regulator n=1 Tax=Pseudoalteromonas phenolica TaxID=161398 RepID=A0A0S2JZD0_9GAMM|nr:AraC family transcriptional regulator [Pseudoalteromonas phenolica]ALO41157.1 AraC family transcriptional regulator [Pseudoalteromonas phenolica]MBE0354311.1 AraC family transcriptional regulator [Pseudoalteromonas phenolica O-BC30]RXE92282.1 AraC family transcriptional regulator [Pseudoalteromonas phenolica O-BC30]
MNHKLVTKNQYEQRLLGVIDYIYEHVDGELDVNVLADVACMSSYHFHRIYREFAGETINVTVRRMRLLKAAAYLVRSDLSQQQIAKKVGYGSIEAFNRAFSKHYRETPNQYRIARAVKQVTMLYPKSDKEYKTMYQVEQQTTPALSLIAIEHSGDYMQIGQAFEKLSMMASKLDLLNDKTRFFGIYYDDPKTVNTDKLRSKACISVDLNTLPKEHEFEVMSIPASNSVSLLFKGDYPELEKPYDWLFGEYLPSSQYQLKDFPPFEEYLNDLREVAPQDLLTRIYCLVE